MGPEMGNIDAPNDSSESYDNVKSPEEVINGSETFDELYVALGAIGQVPGTLNMEPYNYSADELKRIIDRVRRGKGLPGDVTRTYGLRGKVMELLAIKTGIEDPREAIEAAESFDDLYLAMDKLGNIRLGSEARTVKQEKAVIREVEGEREIPRNVTRDFNIRDKVTELLRKKHGVL